MRASWARASQNALSTVVKLWSAKIMAYLLATRRSAQHVDVLEEARHMPIHTGGGGAFTHLYRTCALGWSTLCTIAQGLSPDPAQHAAQVVRR
jgi:hypothetical protein